jgi:hypothetical protein
VTDSVRDDPAEPVARLTAGARDLDGAPWRRDEYAQTLSWRLDRPISTDPVALTEAETTVTARLLEELAAVYPGEPLGQLASYLAMTLSARAWAADEQ